MAPTMRLTDIAEHAGVSEATVSRVLNAKPGVAPATRQAVLTALDVLGYERPARLTERRAGLIGLIIPELTNPIFPAFAQTIETAVAMAGYTAVLCTQSPGGITEDDYTDLLLERGVSGIVFVNGLHANTRSDPARYRRLTERGLPIVLVNGYRPDIDACFISNDDASGIEATVTHLASLGHRQIGLALGQDRFATSIRRAEGFRKTMSDRFAQTDTEPLIVNTLFTIEGGQAAAGLLLEQGCTAICAGNDIMALGVISRIRAEGLRVPEDVSVTGFDDSPLTAYLDPPLTTIRQPVREMSLAAVSNLIDEIGGMKAPRTELLYRPELVVRRSTAPAPAG